MFLKTVGPANAKIMIVADYPTQEEFLTSSPFTNFTFNQIISQSGINRFTCLMTYIIKVYPLKNNPMSYYSSGKFAYPFPELKAWIEDVKREILLYKPNIVIAMGKIALHSLCGKTNLDEFRGYVISGLIPGLKIIPTYSIHNINISWDLLHIAIMDFRKALFNSASPEPFKDERIIEDNPTAERFISYCNEIIFNPEINKVALDIENIQPGTHITRIGLSHHINFGISFNFCEGGRPVLPPRDELRVWEAINRLVNHKLLIMQNSPHDMGTLWLNNRILCKKIYMDTLIAAHVCFPEFPRSLLFLSSICLNVAPWKKSEKLNEGIYNATDAANTYGIADVLDKEIDRQKVRKTFDFEMSQIPVALMLQLQGLYVDLEIRDILKDCAFRTSQEAKEGLEKLIGKEINYNSPKQLQKLLYEDLGLPIQYKRRKQVSEPRTPTADAKALERLERMVPDNPLFQLVLIHKKAEKLISSFLDIELSKHNTVHTSYNITGATAPAPNEVLAGNKSFGRWSSNKSIILPYGSGNLQNIPPIARLMYTAKPGYVFVQADYVQAEAVMVAHYSQDRKLIDMFNKSYGLKKSERGEYDLHKLTYAWMYQMNWQDVTKEQRRIGKTIRHATSYNAGAGVIADQLKCSVQDAKYYLSTYLAMCPQLAVWHRSIQNELRVSKVLTNAFGRKHCFLDRWGDSLFRSAYAYKPQSSVGDLLNMAMTKFYQQYGEEFNICLQLHDAFYVKIPTDKLKVVVNKMKECMKIPIIVNHETFYIDVDFKIGDSWGDMKEYEI